MFSIGATKIGPATARLRALRDQIARIERGNGHASHARVIPFGIPAIDQALPGGGVVTGALHEAAGAGPDVEHGAAAALFIAGILARTQGPVLWVLAQPDLFAPGLAGAGLSPERVIFAEAGKQVLGVMEEGLQHPGLAAVVGEVQGRLTLVASRRLQLAAEQNGALAFALRRSRTHDDKALLEPTAAMTRWRIGALPSPPPLPQAPDTPGLGPALWRLELLRCRGGEPAGWVVEVGEATGQLALSSDTAEPGVAIRAA